MKWIIFIFLLFPTTVLASPFSATTPVYSATNSINIQRGANNLGQDVVFAYWEMYGATGQTVHYCSITLVADFLSNIEVKKNLLETLTTTPGAKWGWTAIVPSNINPWCLQ